MSADRHGPIEISERELQSMTGDLDEMHRATLAGDARSTRRVVGTASSAPHRRGADRAEPARLPPRRGCRTRRARARRVREQQQVVVEHRRFDHPDLRARRCGGKLTGDLAVVALAAGLENLAAQTYGAGITAATAGKLGTVPPAVVTFAQTVKAQHIEHAAAWNAVLAGAKGPR